MHERTGHALDADAAAFRSAFRTRRSRKTNPSHAYLREHEWQVSREPRTRIALVAKPAPRC
jgi:hypothetical protein